MPENTQFGQAVATATKNPLGASATTLITVAAALFGADGVLDLRNTEALAAKDEHIAHMQASYGAELQRLADSYALPLDGCRDSLAICQEELTRSRETCERLLRAAGMEIDPE